MTNHDQNRKRLTGSFWSGRLLALLTFSATLWGVAAVAVETASPLAGNWEGALHVGGARLRLSFVITESEGKLSGNMRSLDQGGASIALSTVTERNRQVRLAIASIGGGFEGKLNTKADELAGTWEQGGAKLPLTLKRSATEAVLRRPQEPKEPYPYRAEEVTIPTLVAGVTLAGTFTVPNGAGPHPAVVLLTGSGPQNRDEFIMGHRPFLVLADHLTRQGIAVLRCDDRGVGKSTGDFSKATHLDFVEDALAAVSWLKARKEVDPRRTGLVGHSEGGIVAPLAAVKAPGDVAFIVLLAGVGVPMDELLIRQGVDVARTMGATEDILAKSVTDQRELYRQLKLASDSAVVEKLVRDTAARQLAQYTPEQQKAMGMSAAMLEGQIKMAATPWFRQLLAYDPGPALRQVKCPVLAINGEKDIQVSAKENIEGIARALADGGNRNVKTTILPGLNHLFQTCKTGAVSEYGEIEETMSPAALSAVSEWIKQQAR